MTTQTTVLALVGFYLLAGLIVLTDLNITPASIRRHYQHVALTDPETARLMRKYPRLCSVSHVVAYLVELVLWPVVARRVAQKK